MKYTNKYIIFHYVKIHVLRGIIALTLDLGEPTPYV